MNRIGLIGVGKMGLPLLNTLVKHGYYVNTLLSHNTKPIDGVTDYSVSGYSTLLGNPKNAAADNKIKKFYLGSEFTL